MHNIYICRQADPIDQFWEIISHKSYFKSKGSGCIMLQEKIAYVWKEIFEALQNPVLYWLQPSHGH